MTTTIHRHWGGYQAAQDAVQNMTHDQLLNTLDSLYGRGKVADWNDTAAVRSEAVRQVEEDWRVPENYTGAI